MKKMIIFVTSLIIGNVNFCMSPKHSEQVDLKKEQATSAESKKEHKATQTSLSPKATEPEDALYALYFKRGKLLLKYADQFEQNKVHEFLDSELTKLNSDITHFEIMVGRKKSAETKKNAEEAASLARLFE